MADTVTLSINDEQVTVPRGTLVIDAATRMGIEIPVFCSHPKLDPVACCRQCLVEMEGPRGTMLNTACNMPCMPDMVVRTNTPAVQAAQEANLAFILLHHPLDCPICDKGGECPLQDMTMRFGPGVSQLVEPKRRAQKNYDISDTIVLDQERCVICWRCVRYLEEWEEKPQLGLFERGGDTIIDVQPGTCVDAKTSGNIIDICPVGALTNRGSRFQYRPWQVERTPTISLHDPMGNNISVDTRNGTEVRRILGRENMGVNDQFITDRDRFCHHWVGHPDRLTKPLVRRSPNEQLTEVSWPEALDFAARRLQEVSAAAGPAALGAIGSAKLSNESNYLLQRMARQHLQTPNVDHRQGGDVKAAPTGVPSLAHLMQPQYGPKPEADLIVLFGVDPAEEIPMLDVTSSGDQPRRLPADFNPSPPDRKRPPRPVTAVPARPGTGAGPKSGQGGLDTYGCRRCGTARLVADQSRAHRGAPGRRRIGRGRPCGKRKRGDHLRPRHHPADRRRRGVAGPALPGHGHGPCRTSGLHRPGRQQSGMP